MMQVIVFGVNAIFEFKRCGIITLDGMYYEIIDDRLGLVKIFRRMNK